MQNLLNGVARLFVTIAAIMVILLLLTQIHVVILRYVFSLGWPWASDLLTYLFYLSIVLPAISVLLDNKSVRVDIFYAGWITRRKIRLDRLALLGLIFPATTYASIASWPIMINSWRLFEASPTIGGLPGYFILKAFLFLFFLGLAITSFYLGLQKKPYDYGEDA